MKKKNRVYADDEIGKEQDFMMKTVLCRTIVILIIFFFSKNLPPQLLLTNVFILSRYKRIAEAY